MLVPNARSLTGRRHQMTQDLSHRRLAVYIYVLLDCCDRFGQPTCFYFLPVPFNSSHTTAILQESETPTDELVLNYRP
jgi:hypothetical protein